MAKTQEQWPNSQVGLVVKNPPAMQETLEMRVPPLGREDLLKEERHPLQ